MYIICGQKYLCLLLIGIKLHIRTTLNATKSVCNEKDRRGCDADDAIFVVLTKYLKYQCCLQLLF